jgi:vitamin B12 transporter
VASGNYTKSVVGFSGKYKFIDLSVGASMAHAGDYTVGKGSLHGKGAANNVQGSRVYANTGLHEQLAVLTNLGFNFYENHRLGVIYSGYLSGQGRPGDLRNTGSNSPLAYGQRKNDSIDVQYTGETADQNLSWMVRYYNGTTRYTTASIWYVQPKYMYYDYGTDFSGYQGQVNWDYSVIHLTGGFESYENIYFQVNTPPYQSSFTNTAFYLLGRAGLINETLWLSFGGRYDKFTSEGQADPQKENRFTPSLGVAYLPLDWLKLRVNYGESFKMPTPDRLAGNSTSSGGTTYIGNPNLKPQTAKSWDFGLDVYYEAFTAGITYFTTDYKDMIQTRTIQPAPNRIDTYENLTGITKYEGLEFNFDWEMGDTFNWEFDLRPYIAFTRLFKRHEPNGNELETVADMSMAYGITFKHPDIGLIASLDANYYGKQMPNDASVQWGGIRFGGDNVLDFHISKDLLSWDAYGTVKVKVDVLNVTDKLYQVSAGYPQPGRTFSFSLVYDY